MTNDKKSMKGKKKIDDVMSRKCEIAVYESNNEGVKGSDRENREGKVGKKHTRRERQERETIFFFY